MLDLMLLSLKFMPHTLHESLGVPPGAHPLRVVRCASDLWFWARCALRVAQWLVVTLRVVQWSVVAFSSSGKEHLLLQEEEDLLLPEEEHLLLPEEEDLFLQEKQIFFFQKKKMRVAQLVVSFEFPRRAQPLRVVR